MERDLEDLRERMKRALEDPKKVAEVAVAALRSPYNAYGVVSESTKDKQLAQDWRNTLMLKRDQEKYGVNFSEELASVFSESNQEKRREEMETTQVKFEIASLEKLSLNRTQAIEGLTKFVEATLRNMRSRGDAIPSWDGAHEFEKALENKLGGFGRRVLLCYTDLPVATTESSFLRTPYYVYFGFPWWDGFYPSLLVEAPGCSIRLVLPEEKKFREEKDEDLPKCIEELLAREENYLILADLIVQALSNVVKVFDEVLYEKVFSVIRVSGDAQKEEYWGNVREMKNGHKLAPIYVTPY